MWNGDGGLEESILVEPWFSLRKDVPFLFVFLGSSKTVEVSVTSETMVSENVRVRVDSLERVPVYDSMGVSPSTVTKGLEVTRGTTLM